MIYLVFESLITMQCHANVNVKDAGYDIPSF